MNRIIEYVAMALGGLSLFAVCFMGFAVMAGKPVNSLPVVGSFFEAPDLNEEDPSTTAQATPTTPPRQRKDEDIVHSSLGVLGAWTLPSPYTVEELRTLTDELKARRFRLEQREADVDRREAELADRDAQVDERFAGLEAMRSQLESYEAELAKREAELRSGEEAAELLQDQKWADVAAMIGALDADASNALVEYSPEEAAKILRQLDPETAAGILAGIRGGPKAGEWKRYVDAYSTSSQP